VMLKVPSLKRRIEDIPLLVRYFIQQFASSVSSVTHLSNEALTHLYTYSWPGNVRELENVIRRAVAMGRGSAITPNDLPENIYNENNTGAPCHLSGGASLAAYEISAIRNALLKTAGHRKKAAQMLGIGEATLYRKLKKYHIE
jgi:two-component system response regulator HydG